MFLITQRTKNKISVFTSGRFCDQRRIKSGNRTSTKRFDCFNEVRVKKFGKFPNDNLSIFKGFDAQPIGDNLYKWQVKLFGFDPESDLAKDFAEYNTKYGIVKKLSYYFLNLFIGSYFNANDVSRQLSICSSICTCYTSKI
jgi:hypothetical protein